MKKVLPIILALLALALASTATASPHRRTPLRWRGDASYRVLLPATWRLRNASYPSDHATYFWFDPANPLRKLMLVFSGCVGCVSRNYDGRTPNPYGMVPHGSETYRISPWKVAFENGYTPDDPYDENGVVIVLVSNHRIVGSAVASLWLPTRDHSLATTILNSFRPKGARS